MTVPIFASLKDIIPEQRTYRRVIMQQIDAEDAGGDAINHRNTCFWKRRKKDNEAYGLYKDKGRGSFEEIYNKHIVYICDFRRN
jgi:hypothetical protein